MTVSIRDGRLDDADRIAALVSDLGHPTTPEQVARRLAPVLDDPNHATFVVTWLSRLVLILFVAVGARAESGATAQARIDEDLARGEPIVVHVVVALCDNVHQGIVPVPEKLGNGQDPKNNLYWGALYGVRTHLSRAGGWTRLATDRPDDRRILDRAAWHARLPRREETASVYLVADAWDGERIRDALDAFSRMSAGAAVEEVTVRPSKDAEPIVLRAGGAAHVVTYVGHDGLMDFELPAPNARPESAARSAIVLACASKRYFHGRLEEAGAHPLLLTTGLMAPEAYTLDAAVRAWIEKGTTTAVRDAAADAYHRYQRCGLRAARRLFWGETE